MSLTAVDETVQFTTRANVPNMHVPLSIPSNESKTIVNEQDGSAPEVVQPNGMLERMDRRFGLH